MHHKIEMELQCCVDLCGELKKLLEEERSAIVHLRTDELLQNNLSKKTLLEDLIKHRGEFKRLMLDADVDPTACEPWLMEWQQALASLKQVASKHQGFIRHSLQNISRIVENLKDLFRERPLYSAVGKSLELNDHGKMIQVSL